MRIRGAWGPALLLLIVIGFFWKLVLTDQYTWLETPDLANQVVPWFQYQAQQFHLHRLPLWDPFLFTGQSLIGQAQPGLAYPLNWILFSLPLDQGHISFTALNWYYLAIHYLAALFCYWLCRDLGRSVIASVLGGAAFALGGYIGYTDWPQMINGAIWAPLVFLFLLRAARGLRPIANGAFSGLFLGMSWLSGHHQVPVFLSLAAGATWLYFLASRREGRRTLFAAASVFVVFFALTSALQILPAYEYGQTAVRWVGANDPVHWNQAVPYTVHQQYSLSPIHLLGFVIPGYMSNVNTFAGVVMLAIAALALACSWKTKDVKLFVALGLAGLLLALARNDIFHGVLYSIVPMLEKARSPAVALFLFHFAIAVLAAFGVDALLAPASRATVRRIAIAVAGFGAVTWVVIFVVKMARALNWNLDDRVMMSTLAAFALAGILYRVSRQAGEAVRYGPPILIVALYLIEIGNVSLYSLPNKEEKDRNVLLKNYANTVEAAKFLRKQPGPIRVDVSIDDVPFNFGDWYGIDTVNGYAASLPEAFSEAEVHTERVKLLLGANYALSKKATMEGQEWVFQDDNGLSVFRNPRALPRVWVVHEGVQVKDASGARKNFQDAGFDLSKKTFGYAPLPAMDQCEGDTVRRFERDVDSTTVVVDMKCHGMVVMSESNAPGWSAFVDGRRVPIYDAYTMLRGVVVGPGMHRVETRYRPWSVTAGAVGLLSGFVGALVLWAAGRKRSYS